MKTVWAVVIIVVASVIVASVVVGLKRGKQKELAPSREATKQESMQKIKVTSSAFLHNGKIPEQFTCDGNPPAGGVSPPLEISGAPDGAKTLALIMHDPDAPRAGGWTHWVKWNIPPETKTIAEGAEPAGISGKGTGGELTYQGPCPPRGEHRYVWSIYALDVELSLKEGATKTELESAMQGHVLAEGELIGRYSRKQ